jgi:hypothetical protein
MLALLEDVDIPVGVKTFAASAAAALFRIVLMPVDAAKTIMQVGVWVRVGGKGVGGWMGRAWVGGAGGRGRSECLCVCMWKGRRLRKE